MRSLDDTSNDGSNDDHQWMTVLPFNSSGNHDDSRQQNDTNVVEESIISQLSSKFKREWKQSESVPKFFTKENLPKHAMIIGTKSNSEDNNVKYNEIYRAERDTKYIPLEVLLYKLICRCQDEYQKPDHGGIDFYPVHENQLLFVRQDQNRYIPIQDSERDEVIL